MSSDKPWKFHPAMIGYSIAGLGAIILVIVGIQSFLEMTGIANGAISILIIFGGLSVLFHCWQALLRKNINTYTHLISPASVLVLLIFFTSAITPHESKVIAARAILLAALIGLIFLLVFWKSYKAGE